MSETPMLTIEPAFRPTTIGNKEVEKTLKCENEHIRISQKIAALSPTLSKMFKDAGNRVLISVLWNPKQFPDLDVHGLRTAIKALHGVAVSTPVKNLCSLLDATRYLNLPALRANVEMAVVGLAETEVMAPVATSLAKYCTKPYAAEIMKNVLTHVMSMHKNPCVIYWSSGTLKYFVTYNVLTHVMSMHKNPCVIYWSSGTLKYFVTYICGQENTEEEILVAVVKIIFAWSANNRTEDETAMKLLSQMSIGCLSHERIASLSRRGASNDLSQLSHYLLDLYRDNYSSDKCVSRALFSDDERLAAGASMIEEMDVQTAKDSQEQMYGSVPLAPETQTYDVEMEMSGDRSIMNEMDLNVRVLIDKQ